MHGGMAAQSQRLRLVDAGTPGGSVLAVEDLDGDGDGDAITTTGVYLSRGDFAFVPHGVPAPLALGAAWRARLGDIDGDGDPDVAVCGAQGAGVLFNDGSGGLVEAAIALPPPPLHPILGGACVPHAIAVGDVDGDLDADIAVAFGLGAPNTVASVPGPLGLWLNVGAGSFVDASAMLPGTLLAAALFELADHDLDGDLDLVAAGTGSVAPSTPSRILFDNVGLGNFVQGPATFSTGVSSYAGGIGDCDGDGRPDVVLVIGSAPNQGIEVVWNRPSGFASTATPVAAAQYPHVAVVDTNGDGICEVVHLTESGGSENGRGGGGGLVELQSFAVASSAPPGARLSGDVDGDGDGDVLVPGPGAPRVLASSSGGLQVLPVAAGTGTHRWYGLLGDADGDGSLDLLCRDTVTSRVRAVLNDGDGTFGPDVSAAGAIVGWLSTAVAIDHDLDGDTDLYVSGSLTNTWVGPTMDHLLSNDGTGSFTAAGLGTWSGFASVLRAGDVDGDGDADVVIMRHGIDASGSLVPYPTFVVRNLGGGTFASPVQSGSGAAADMALCDTDGDGDQDILRTTIGAGGAGGPWELLRNDGTGAFATIPGTPAISALFVAAGDLDGDGDQDVVFDRSVFRNTGSGNLEAAGMLPGTCSTPHEGRMTLADMDADGDPDLVTEAGRLYINDGSGAFAPPEIFAGGVPGVESVNPPPAVADIDRDGDLDVVLSGPRVFVNMGRQVLRAGVARLGRPAGLGVAGPPGGLFLLFASPLPAATPIPGMGLLLVDPTHAVPVLGGAFPPSGEVGFNLMVPAEPALAGARIFWQGIAGLPARLTNRMVTTILDL